MRLLKLLLVIIMVIPIVLMPVLAVQGAEREFTDSLPVVANPDYPIIPHACDIGTPEPGCGEK